MNAPKSSPVQIDSAQIEPDRRRYETPDDEISLLDLLDLVVRTVDFLIRKKSLILSIAAIFTLLSAIYALSITSKYKATIGFLMPQETFLPETFSKQNTTEFQKAINETKISLYQQFLLKIQSYNFQREVFDRGNFLEKFTGNSSGSVNSDAVVLEINKSISLAGIPAKNSDLFNKPVFLEMEGSKPEAMAGFLNALVKKGMETLHFKDHVYNTIDQRLKNISSEKTLLLSQEKINYAQEVAKLEKELAMARNMNIEDNNFKSDRPLNGAPRWYLYGAQILETELKALKSKAQNSSVIEAAKPSKNIKIKNLDKEFKTWESFKSLEIPDVIVIDQPSIPPAHPIRNEKAIIISIGLLAGLFFGSAVAFFQHARRNLNARRSLVSEVNKKTKSFVIKHSSQAAS